MNPKIPGAKSRKEVAREYGISERTLSRWFKKANLHLHPGLIDPYHLQTIYETFGDPKDYEAA
jgi:transposase-like protein